VAQAIALTPLGLWFRRSQLREAWRTSWVSGFCGGVIASILYGIAVWAMSLGPVAP
jgi:hypothetical protein